MKRISTIFTMLILTVCMTMAQTLPLDFESDYGANLLTGDGGQAEIVSDPDASGTHGQVLKYIESGPTVAWDQDGPKQWQLVKIKLIGNYIDLTGVDKTVTFDVYTTEVAGGIIKLESSLNGGSSVEVGFTTAGSGWESISLDFSVAWNGSVVSANDEYLHVLFLPGYDGAGGEKTITNGVELYFDNITGPVGTAVAVDPLPATNAPVPNHSQSDVTAIFSDSYIAPGNVDYNPGWWQSTEFSLIDINGRSTLKFGKLNYQGTTFDAMDVSAADYLHFDYWTADGIELRASPISQNTGETAYHISTITQEQWTSVDIPISYFTNAKPDMLFNDIYQFKFDTEGTPGNFSYGTFYIDNVYFYKDQSTGLNAIDESDVSVYPNPATDVLNISGAAEGAVLEIYSVHGAMVKQAIVANGTISVANLEVGVYIVKAGDSVIKLIKK
ncbi:T9SS type A sorting domain-containing protein [Carboxylicivirga mesophila]|uniref:T9SS type A sorting domain-containing protein n=1 Tax=Carboxylicivirga mesophila TaxID=1166478 RepID=A0ABS5KFL1_9BACT|nr:T9SS type A sorting domain-containing protein [Carboxylicivirga mesophila]MBS2213108.1 T9SS type A sorting domain-containing protein [Carboxylicivirga mesophila]